MKFKSKLLGNSIIFTLMTVLQKGMAFLLLPLYTNTLLPEESGMANMVISVCSVYMLIVSLAMDDSAARQVFEFKDDERKRKAAVSTSVFVSLIAGFAGTVIILTFNKVFLMGFVGGADFFPSVLLGAAPVLFSSVYTIVQKLLVIEGEAMHYSLNSVCYFLLQAGLSILFIVFFKMGGNGMLLANAITYFVFFVYSLIYLRPYLSRSFDRQIAKSSIKYGITLLPNRIANWGITPASKIILGNLTNDAFVGIYNLGTTISSTMTILSESFSNALQPWMYAQLESKPKKNKNIVIIFQIMSAVYIVLGLGISLFFNEVMLVFGKNYSEVISIIPALIWGGVTSAISSLFVFVLFYFQDKAKYVAISTVIGAVANFGLCFLLIPSFGLAGCAYSLSISKLIMCLIRCIASAKTIECGYSVIIWTQAMALLTLLVSTFLINSGFLVRLAAFFALTLVLILIVFKSIKSFIEILKDKSYTEQ